MFWATITACVSGKPDSTPDSAGDDTAETAETGDSSPETGDTGDVVHDPLPVNRMCLIPSGATASTVGDATYTATASGVITDAGTGEPPGGCRDRGDWLGSSTMDWSGTTTAWLEIEEGDGDVWIAGITHPRMVDASSLVGLDAELDYRSVLGEPFAGIAEEAELSLFVPGFLFWQGTAGSLDALSPTWPDLALTAGAEEYEESGECGIWRVSSLHGDRGSSVADVETASEQSFDGLTLWSGGVVEDVKVTCSETTFAYASVAEWMIE